MHTPTPPPQSTPRRHRPSASVYVYPASAQAVAYTGGRSLSSDETQATTWASSSPMHSHHAAAAASTPVASSPGSGFYSARGRPRTSGAIAGGPEEAKQEQWVSSLAASPSAATATHLLSPPRELVQLHPAPPAAASPSSTSSYPPDLVLDRSLLAADPFVGLAHAVCCSLLRPEQVPPHLPYVAHLPIEHVMAEVDGSDEGGSSTATSSQRHRRLHSHAGPPTSRLIDLHLTLPSLQALAARFTGLPATVLGRQMERRPRCGVQVDAIEPVPAGGGGVSSAQSRLLSFLSAVTSQSRQELWGLLASLPALVLWYIHYDAAAEVVARMAEMGVRARVVHMDPPPAAAATDQSESSSAASSTGTSTDPASAADAPRPVFYSMHLSALPCYSPAVVLTLASIFAAKHMPNFCFEPSASASAPEAGEKLQGKEQTSLQPYTAPNTARTAAALAGAALGAISDAAQLRGPSLSHTQQLQAAGWIKPGEHIPPTSSSAVSASSQMLVPFGSSSTALARPSSARVASPASSTAVVIPRRSPSIVGNSASSSGGGGGKSIRKEVLLLRNQKVYLAAKKQALWVSAARLAALEDALEREVQTLDAETAQRQLRMEREQEALEQRVRDAQCKKEQEEAVLDAEKARLLARDQANSEREQSLANTQAQLESQSEQLSQEKSAVMDELAQIEAELGRLSMERRMLLEGEQALKEGQESTAAERERLQQEAARLREEEERALAEKARLSDEEKALQAAQTALAEQRAAAQAEQTALEQERASIAAAKEALAAEKAAADEAAQARQAQLAGESEALAAAQAAAKAEADAREAALKADLEAASAAAKEALAKEEAEMRAREAALKAEVEAERARVEMSLLQLQEGQDKIHLSRDLDAAQEALRAEREAMQAEREAFERERAEHLARLEAEQKELEEKRKALHEEHQAKADAWTREVAETEERRQMEEKERQEKQAAERLERYKMKRKGLNISTIGGSSQDLGQSAGTATTGGFVSARPAPDEPGTAGVVPTSAKAVAAAAAFDAAASAKKLVLSADDIAALTPAARKEFHALQSSHAEFDEMYRQFLGLSYSRLRKSGPPSIFLHAVLSVEKVDKLQLLLGAMPLLELHTIRAKTSSLLEETEVAKSDTATYRPMIIDVQPLCALQLERSFQIKCMQHSRVADEPRLLIGETRLTLVELQSHAGGDDGLSSSSAASAADQSKRQSRAPIPIPLVNLGRLKNEGKKYSDSGKLLVQRAALFVDTTHALGHFQTPNTATGEPSFAKLSQCMLRIECRGINLSYAGGFFGGVSKDIAPMLELVRREADGTWSKEAAYRTEMRLGTNVVFSPIRVGLWELCFGDINRPFLARLLHDSGSTPAVVSESEVTLAQLLSASSPTEFPAGAVTDKKTGARSGHITFTSVRSFSALSELEMLCTTAGLQPMAVVKSKDNADVPPLGLRAVLEENKAALERARQAGNPLAFNNGEGDAPVLLLAGSSIANSTGLGSGHRPSSAAASSNGMASMRRASAMGALGLESSRAHGRKPSSAGGTHSTKKRHSMAAPAGSGAPK